MYGFCALIYSLNKIIIQKLFTAHIVKLKPNHMLKDEDQLNTHVKVIPGEIRPLRLEGSCS